MKKVVIFGAAGHTGKYITRKMRSMEDVEVTAFVRNPAKFSANEIEGVTVVQGDALNADDVKRAMEGQGHPALLVGGRCPRYGEEHH